MSYIKIRTELPSCEFFKPVLEFELKSMGSCELKLGRIHGSVHWRVLSHGSVLAQGRLEDAKKETRLKEMLAGELDLKELLQEVLNLC